MVTRRDAGLAVLVRSAQGRARPASVSTYLSMAGAVPALASQGENLVGRLDRIRAPLGESGTAALIRASRGRRVTETTVGNELDDRLSTVNAAWVSLKADMLRARDAGTITTAVYNAFRLDFDSWQAFYSRNRGSWIVTHTAMEEVERRRIQLEQWAAVLTGAGASRTGVPTTAPTPGMVDRTLSSLGPGGLGGVGESASNIATAVAVVAVAGVVGLIVIEAGATRRAVT